MSENSEREFFCPLFEKIIDDSYCYEINSVAFDFIQPPSFIKNPGVTDRETAEPFCKVCKNRQIEDDELVYCPLLKGKIADGYCNEITLLFSGWIWPSLIDNVTDEETARPFCENCENRQW